MKDTEVFYPKSKAAWRKWLEKHHLTKESVWLVFFSKASGKASLTWSEAVDEALCFGWIDSKKVKIDEITAHQYFSKRKPKGTWSKINKDKVEKFIELGLMSDFGMEMIELAKQNGSWSLLDEVEQLIVPEDLQTALNKLPNASDYFHNTVSKSVKKAILTWLVLAKQEETRQKRIDEIALLSSQGKKPKQFGG